MQKLEEKAKYFYGKIRIESLEKQKQAFEQLEINQVMAMTL